MNESGCCVVIGSVQSSTETAPLNAKIANQKAALEWCRSTVQLMILVFSIARLKYICLLLPLAKNIARTARRQLNGQHLLFFRCI